MAGRELASQLIGKAGHQTRQWDALGHNTKIETPFWSQDIPENGFDPVGNLSHVYKRDPLGSAEEHYHYDDLYQLVAEEGPLAHTYAYDSLQNRRQKDAHPYSVNELNQTLSCSEARYEYDLDGNRIGKTEADTTTHYIYDALNRLTSVEQRQKWRVTYSYDTFGRRLARTLSTWNINGWSDPQTTSYLYQGQKEIGAMENGHIIQLRVLGNGKGAELGAAIALELNQKVYAPIHDYRGNVCCLVDSETGIAVESYRYSAFGELKIYDSANVAQAYSTIANPWLFASKRLDSHTGLFQFGKRDYDTSIGRWLTPDPQGFSDGPNLYAYVHNNPLTLLDLWGLSALYDRNKAADSGRKTSTSKNRESRGDNVQRESNYSNSRASSACKGICAGIADFGLSVCHSFCDCFCNVGLWDSECPSEEKCAIRDCIDQTQETHRHSFEQGTMNFLGIDPSDMTYQNYRYGATIACEAVALVSGGWGLAKLGWSVGKFAIRGISTTLPKLPVTLNRFHFNASLLSPTAQNNIRILRGWAKSKGWEKLPNPTGKPEQWGIYQNEKFDWRIKIKSEPSVNSNLQSDSYRPRFDARLKGDGSSGNDYINPFTSEIGNKSIGRHLPLDQEY